MKKNVLNLIILLLTTIAFSQEVSLKWAKSIGGADSEAARSITIDDNGNVYTTGYFGGIVDFDSGAGVFNLTSEGEKDIFIQKLDSNGEFLWAKSMGGNEWDMGYSIAIDDSGNVFTTGFFFETVDFDPGTSVYNLTSVGERDIFIQKLDTDGNFLWAKQIGGTTVDKGHSITIDEVGNVYTTGFFEGTVDFDPGVEIHNLTSVGTRDIFIQKLDSEGNFLWVRQIGGTGWEIVNSITIDINGNIYSTGYFGETVDFDPGIGIHNLTSIGLSDFFIQKLDTDGNFLWANSMGGTDWDLANSITIDDNGNVYTTGEFRETVDFDPGTSVYNLTSVGEKDIYIQKLDTDGNFLWAKSMGGTGVDFGYTITTDNNGNVYTSGFFEETVDFNPDIDVNNLTSIGEGDIFIVKLDTDGDFLWAKSMGGTGGDYGRSIATDANGNIYTTGSFIGIVDFDPEEEVYNLTSDGEGDIFIQKLENSTLSLNDYGIDTSYILYPNPSDGQFAIAFESVLTNVEVSVVDVLGRLIYSSSYQNTDIINIEINNPAGVYLVEIKTPHGKKTISLIKK